MSIANVLAAQLDHRGAQLFDERGLISHALDLEHAARVFPQKTEPDVQRLLFEVMFGAKLPAVRFGLGMGKVAAIQPNLAEFRAMLERIIKSPKAAATAFEKDWLSALSKLSKVPAEIRADGRLGYRLVTDELRAVLAYVLALLLDRSQGFDLGRCQLPECDKFFLAPQSKRGGRPRRRYCNKAHMLEVHNRDAARRVRKSRKDRGCK